jgi:hypothetical protein
MDARHKRRMALLVGFVFSGCGLPPEEAEPPSFASRHQAVVQDNGTNLNGTNLNGTNLNGTNLNGTNLNGTNLNSAKLSGVSVEAAWLQGGEIQVRMPGGQVVTGQEVVGLKLQGTDSEGAEIKLKISAATAGSGSNADVWYYSVEYKDLEGAWQPLCAYDGKAVAVAGRWDYRSGVEGGGSHLDDPSMFTLGCRGAAIAKCVELGYKPWASSESGSLSQHHQACTRLLRGDYCGNGTAYTQNGRWVNLYDAVGVQQDTENWSFEAEWTANGAECFSLVNRANLDLVPCFVPKLSLTCGLHSHFSQGTLLMSEIPLL